MFIIINVFYLGMMAIKKKLTQKRRSDSSDSESERSETINTDEDNDELLSDQDEETDDESQDSLEKTDDDNKISEHNQESEPNEESDNEEMDSQNSDAETVKGTVEEIEKKSEFEGNSYTTDNNNDAVSDHQSNKTVASEDIAAKLEEAVINKKNLDDGQTIKLHGGDNTTEQTIQEETKSKNENIDTLLIEGDNNSKEIIKSDKNEDSDNNNSVLSSNDNSLQTAKENANQNKEVIENLNINAEEEKKKS